MIGLIATKEGMTRLFQEDGKSLPVSVLKVDTNFISQIKTKQSDGYDSIQLSTKEQKEKSKVLPWTKYTQLLLHVLEALQGASEGIHYQELHAYVAF